MDRLLTYNWLLETLQSFYIRSTPSVCRARMTSFARPPYSSGGQSINSTSQFNFPQQEGKSSIDPYAELNKTLAYCDCAGVVTESKIRTLARSLTCISRIDKYLVLETKENAIEFRAITDVQDAYIQIRFTSKFFSAFGFAPHIVRQRDPTVSTFISDFRFCLSLFINFVTFFGHRSSRKEIFIFIIFIILPSTYYLGYENSCCRIFSCVCFDLPIYGST